MTIITTSLFDTQAPLLFSSVDRTPRLKMIIKVFIGFILFYFIYAAFISTYSRRSLDVQFHSENALPAEAQPLILHRELLEEELPETPSSMSAPPAPECSQFPGSSFFRVLTERVTEYNQLYEYCRRYNRTKTSRKEQDVARKDVPNIVHYVIFGNHEMTFAFYVNMKSALRVQKPDKVYIHCDCDQLTGKYWERLLQETTLVEVIRSERPTEIHGNKLNKHWIEHSADVMKLLILQKYGGIAIDSDILFNKPLTEYLQYEATVFLNFYRPEIFIGILIAHKESRLIELFLESYKNYNNKQYLAHSQSQVLKLYNRNPSLAYSAGYCEFHDTNTKVSLYASPSSSFTSWRHFSTIHLSLKWDSDHVQRHGSALNETSIKYCDTPYAQMARNSLYGSEDMIL